MIPAVDGPDRVRGSRSDRTPRMARLVGIEVGVLGPYSSEKGLECAPTASEKRAWDELHRVPPPGRGTR